MRNIIVGQSGGPTAVINSSLAGVFVSGKERGFDKVYGMLNGIQGLLSRKYIDLSEYIRTDLDVELLKHTPSAYLGNCRYKLPKLDENNEVYEDIFTILDELEIEVFIYIGGNDSMDTIQKLSSYAKKTDRKQKFMGVPKTVDNDLALTDHCPGFGSAAKFLAMSTKELIRDSWSQAMVRPFVTVIEIMGRNAGWLTGATALARCDECEGPDFIYLPEVEFDLEQCKKEVAERIKEKPSIVIAVSEGVRDKSGKYICELGNDVDYVDPFGHKQLSGTALFLANYLMNELNVRGRAIEFSALQRCSSNTASRVDIDEAFMVGGAAVKAAHEGESEKMIIIERISNDPYMCRAVPKSINEVANAERLVPSNWIDKKNHYVTEEFLEYARPLIQGSYPPITVNGLPKHICLDLKSLWDK